MPFRWGRVRVEEERGPIWAVESIFSHSALLWAWCTVNTRAVYMKRPPRPCLSAEPDTYALAPYLDLLNHSPRVQSLVLYSLDGLNQQLPRPDPPPPAMVQRPPSSFHTWE
ncbi:hypothetical protein CB1_000995014 [Camelus ferus]|nr:hypothetical protein CB1_000995014 [Camelus ferus]